VPGDADNSSSAAPDEAGTEPIRTEEIRAAARYGQLLPYVQPVLDAQETSRVVGAESLLRWVHPRRGILVAAEFMEIVERAGLLAEVDLASVARLAQDLSHLGRAGRSVERVWLNVSLSEVLADQFLSSVAAVAEQAGLGGNRIGVQIHQAALSADRSGIERRMLLARELGVGVAVDRFGLDLGIPQHLGGLPFDAIKLDRSLVARIGMVEARRAISAAIGTAHTSGAAVVAEGVETESQVIVLRELGCDSVQGFLFGDAVPIGELLRTGEPSCPPSTWLG
jgi:EAL domain-containing protein (putative c-di-GMP-specific phosphodiesterase class I)